MKISVMITTRNRSAELQQTLRVLKSMNPPPNELLVTADGCSDDTLEIVRCEFPSARLFINVTTHGSVASRHAMIRKATGEVVVSLDDDSYPLQNDFFGRLPEVLDAHREASVVCFPVLLDGNQYSGAKSPTTPGHYVSAYLNCGAVMRRKFYLNQPGFPEHFIHMYEEPDYALQCYAAGAAVWFEPSLIIRHHLSLAQRQPVKRHHQNARNELWSVWMRCPWPCLPLVSLFRVWRQFRYACTEGFSWAIREPAWWWSALLGIATCVRERCPVPWSRYLAWMKLARQPIEDCAELHRAFGLQTS